MVPAADRPRIAGGGAPSNRLQALLTSFRQANGESLRWAGGAFCGLIGALMLVAPHQFSTPTYGPLRPWLPWLGVVYLIASVGLVCVAVLKPTRWFGLLAHGFAGLALLLLAGSSLLVGARVGAINLAVLGFGMALGPLAGPPSAGGVPRHRDQLVILLGLNSALSGLVFLGWPGIVGGPFNTAMPDYVPAFGFAFLAGGLGVLATQLWPAPPAGARWLAHLLAGATTLGWLAVAVPLHQWIAVAYLGGAGLLLAAHPLLARPWVRIDSASLRVRLALVVAAATGLPLILTVAFITQVEQGAWLEAVGARQTILAETAALDVGDYVGLHRAAVAALARVPEVMDLPAAEQRRLLEGFQAAYPDFQAFSLYDAAGRPVARSDDLTPMSVAGRPMFEQARQTNHPTLTVGAGRLTGLPIFVFGEPVRDGEGRFIGLAVGVLPSSSVAELFGSASSDGEAYLVDNSGRVIAHPNPEVSAVLANLSAHPPVQEALADVSGRGSLVYQGADGDRIAAYAPVSPFGWSVVVERATSEALASQWAGRELAFILLLVVSALGAAFGIAVAHQLIAPLAALARAAARIAGGRTDAPLPPSQISELAHLNASFDRMQRDLRTLERLQQEFIAVITHELRNPLTALKGYAQLLQRREAYDARAVRAMLSQSEMAERVLDDLQDVTRLAAGRLELRREQTELVAIATASVEQAQALAEHHTIELGAPEVPLVGYWDPARLEQVLQNLLSNAIKYSPAGGKVVVRLEDLGSGARISVGDEGPGIAPEELPRLFERFYRAEEARTSQIQGLGLGLFISRLLVEAHGGRIEVESAPGEGSTFRFELPYR